MEEKGSGFDRRLEPDESPQVSTRLFAACPPGLEQLTARELQGLGAEEVHAERGGVTFRGTRRFLYEANLNLRTASRVLLRFATFRATKLAELRRKAGHQPWEAVLGPDRPITLRATCHKSRLYHSGAVAERIVQGIEDRLDRPVHRAQGADPTAEARPQLILARFLHDECVISLDTSGALLHQRGYHLSTAKAPLRENIAAALVILSGWDTASPLLDPFCGSGTIPIEAALLARGIAPGYARRFAFMGWPDFDPALWRSLVETSNAQRDDDPPPILASDRDRGAIETARENAARAGVADCIDFACRSVSAIEPPTGPGWIVTNPPYGVRVSRGQDLRNLYARFGDVLRAGCPGWRLSMVSADVRLEHAVRLSFDRCVPFDNGGLKVRLVSSDIVR